MLFADGLRDFLDRIEADTDLREVANALLYIATTGCRWRIPLKYFPPCPTATAIHTAWSTVYWEFVEGTSTTASPMNGGFLRKHPWLYGPKTIPSRSRSSSEARKRTISL